MNNSWTGTRTVQKGEEPSEHQQRQNSKAVATKQSVAVALPAVHYLCADVAARKKDQLHDGN
eukprot:1977176-Rhodomonas_salina.1